MDLVDTIDAIIKKQDKCVVNKSSMLKTIFG
jgi:hypothetical protein